MTVSLRTPQKQDWPFILQAADASLPWQTAGNRQWLANRRDFDSDSLRRRHYVAERDNAIVGYGSVEEGPERQQFRLFVVTDARSLATVGTALYERLQQDLTFLGAQMVWAREEARDAALMDFFRQHGFQTQSEFRTDEGLDVVVLRRRLVRDTDNGC